MLINNALGHFRNTLITGCKKAQVSRMNAPSIIEKSNLSKSAKTPISQRSIQIQTKAGPAAAKATTVAKIALGITEKTTSKAKKSTQRVCPEIDVKGSKFNSKQSLQEIYQSLREEISEKLQKANESGKQLLILVGECHESLDSRLMELMILQISKQFAIDNCLIESTEEDCSALDTFEDWDLLYANCLGMNMIAVDPKQADADIKVRQQAMNDAIKSLRGHSVMTVGASHLHPIANDSAITEKYECLVFDTTNIDESFRNKMLLDITLEMYPRPSSQKMILESFNPQFAQRLNMPEHATKQEKISLLRELFNWLSKAAQKLFDIEKLIGEIIADEAITI